MDVLPPQPTSKKNKGSKKADDDDDDDGEKKEMSEEEEAGKGIHVRVPTFLGSVENVFELDQFHQYYGDD